MGIDRSLLNEFIKITNDKKETKQTQLYGTVVTQGNSKYVKIDGSEIITPVRSTTDIKDDERVIVKIDNHMATITGNMTNPSVGNDRVEFTEGKIDRFDHLFAGNITAENIAANSITSDKILAGSITTDKLMAECIISDKIAADTIEAKHIKSDVIESEHIKAGSIEAEHIKSGIIESDHISSGTITADKIATGTITAGSGIIADGAIGSAQISSLDVAKLESGTIDTSKIYIAGADGHLQLKGNRLQVFDGLGNRAVERVSVGDVNGDGSKFGLRVRGADGETILLDENGVTSEGITDGSITNDKISEDANIDGAKLNINSVVSKINEDGTETIQGTKIEVDGTTLNTKLSTITTKQTEDSEKISQAQSQITANTNAIKLKVDEQTYTTDKKDMTSKLEKNTSEISTMKGQIALKVEHTDIENAKSELEGAMDSKINSAKAEIKVTTDAISQNVSNLSQTVSTKADGSTVTTLSNKVGSLETGVNGISGKVTSLEKTTTTLGTQVDTANTNASSALNKANSATTTANNAQNTANTNKNNITDLQGEVSIVKSNVASLEVTTSGISQKVSSVESTTTTLSGKVNTANNNATNALNKANSANTLADSKAKVFTSTPTVPYKVGDLWVQGTNGDVMKCKTARASGSYTASDWEKASKYTDDTKANAVDGKVTTLQGTVNTTNSKVATLETNLNGITQRVSSTENTTATLTTKVNNAQNTANQAKTDAGNANNNATNAINKANDANAKVDGIQVGGRNLLLNSGNFKNTSQWFLNGGSNLRVENKDGFSCLSATGSVKHNAIKLEPDTKYIYWTEIMFNTDVSVNNIIPLHYWLKSMPSGTTKGSVSIVSGSGTAKANKWNKIVLQITTGSLVNGDTHIELTPFIYKNPMPESWWMKYIKVEKGTKATDWSPAPEDVQSQIDTHTTQITTTNNKVSEIKTDLNGITSRVGTVESKQTTTDGKITGLETRMTTAESKITESAITNTVKKNFYTKTETDSQITSKGYQTSSQVQQTVDALQMKFEQSGGYNLLKNSAFKNGTNGWSTLRWDTQAGGNNNIGVRNIGNDWTPTNRNSLDASVTNLPNTSVNKPLRAGFDSHKFKVRPNTAYTLNCLMAQHRTRSITIEMLCYDSADNRIGTSSYSVTLSNVKSGGRDRNNWTKVKHTWTTPSNAVTCHLRAYMNEWTGEGDSAFMWICEPLITEGNSNLPWTPNADEVYTGITTIDKEGITVNQSNISTYTTMDASSFRVENNTGGTVAEFSQNSQIPNLTAGIINANEIYSPSICTKSPMSGSIKYIVNGSTGNDNNNGTTYSTPFKTVAKAVSMLNTQQDRSVDIEIYGNVTGFDVKGINGTGAIRFYFSDDAIVNGAVIIGGITNTIGFHGGSSDKATFKNGISIYRCRDVEIGSLTFRGTNSSGTNIYLEDVTFARIMSCDLGGLSTQLLCAVQARRSNLWIYNCRGSKITDVVAQSEFSIAYAPQAGTTNVPDYSNAFLCNYDGDGRIHNWSGGNFVKTPSKGWNPAYTPTQKTQTWSFNKIWSDETLHGWSDRQELIQGYASTWKTGRWTGYIQMTDDFSEIRNAISGGTNLSGRIYVQRTSSSGNSTGSKLCLYGSDGTLITNSTSINRSQGVWVSLSSSIIQKIQSGAIRYFYLKADANNSSTYFKCERNCKIEITYTK